MHTDTDTDTDTDTHTHMLCIFANVLYEHPPSWRMGSHVIWHHSIHKPLLLLNTQTPLVCMHNVRVCSCVCMCVCVHRANLYAHTLSSARGAPPSRECKRAQRKQNNLLFLTLYTHTQHTHTHTHTHMHTHRRPHTHTYTHTCRRGTITAAIQRPCISCPPIRSPSCCVCVFLCVCVCIRVRIVWEAEIESARRTPAQERDR